MPRRLLMFALSACASLLSFASSPQTVDACFQCRQQGSSTCCDAYQCQGGLTTGRSSCSDTCNSDCSSHSCNPGSDQCPPGS